VQARHVPAALDVLSDILQHPRFPEKAIQRERGVILREMEEVSLFYEFAVLYLSCPSDLDSLLYYLRLEHLTVFSLSC
jgi:hypothetical protein